MEPKTAVIPEAPLMKAREIHTVPEFFPANLTKVQITQTAASPLVARREPWFRGAAKQDQYRSSGG